MFSTTGNALQPSVMGDRMMSPSRSTSNPWVSDHVLLSLSLWWVQSTRPLSPDLPSEVGVIFHSLQQQLQ